VELDLHDHDTAAARQLIVDYVVAGTGYDVDVTRLDFLDVDLRKAIRCANGAPILTAAFETSIPGLRFIGPISAGSFGPLFRFVVGAEYTAKVVSRHLASQAS
jgi:hypothetical protein